MFGLTFKRSMGAVGDRKELEYIIALHQTCAAGTRENATVSSTDISSFLMSRYSLRITHQEALDVVRSLGGGDTRVSGNGGSSHHHSMSVPPIETTHKARGGMLQVPHFFRVGNNHSGDALETSNNTNQGGEALRAISSLAFEADDSAVNRSDPADDLSISKRSFQNGSHYPETERTGPDETLYFSCSLHADSKNNQIQVETVAESFANENGAKREPSSINSSNGGDDGGTGKDDDSCVDIFYDATCTEKVDDDHNTKKDDEDQQHDEYLDLVQILSAILIPTIARAADEDRNGVQPHTEAVPDPLADSANLWTKRVVYPITTLMAELGNKHFEKQRPKPKGIFDHALAVLLKDYISTNPEPFLTEEFVRELLLKNGELERAENAPLIQEMVQAAQSSSGRLDRDALINAMSSDLSEWNVASEDRLSTFFFDVFGMNNPRKVTSLYEEPPEEKVEHDEEAMKVADANTDNHPSSTRSTRCYKQRGKVFATETTNIDMVVDAHSSICTHVVIFIFFLFTVVVYGSQIMIETQGLCSGNEFGCMVGSTILTWLFLAVILSVFGMIQIVPLSIGNNPFEENPRNRLFAFGVAVAYTIVPYSISNSVKAHKLKNEISTVEAEWHVFCQRITFGIGVTLAALFAVHMIVSCTLKRAKWIPRVPRLFAHLTAKSNVRGESFLKFAATRKLNTLLMNADVLHGLENFKSGTASQDRGALTTRKATRKQLKAAESLPNAMRNYVLNGEPRQWVGGIMWTWRGILDGSLFADEGLWINSRLIVFLVGMVVVAFVATILMFWSVVVLAEAAEHARETSLDSTVPAWVDDMIPTGAMVKKSLYPSAIIATIVLGLLINIYIPSAVSTVLKYRSQVRPSLGSPYFNKYRNATQNVYMNTANAVYGMMGSAALFYIVIGFIIFICVWPPTRDGALMFLAWCLGLTITVLLKMIMTRSCRSAQYRSFYRIRPRAARVSSLALECWFIGLGGSVVLNRVLQFLLAAIFWVGRIDAAFLSEDVSLFGYAFDYVPTYFIQDLLVHEAHRHPYLERLAQMYLMKLRHRGRFVSNAGAAWRQLFVVSFFPWLAQRRVFHDERFTDAMDELDARKKLEEEEKNQEGLVEKAGGMAGIAGLGVVATADAIDQVGNEIAAGLNAVGNRDSGES